MLTLGLPTGSAIKNLPAAPETQEMWFRSLIGKIPWRRAWQPTLVFLPGEPMDRGTSQATVHGVAKSQTRLKWLSTHAHANTSWNKERDKPCRYMKLYPRKWHLGKGFEVQLEIGDCFSQESLLPGTLRKLRVRPWLGCHGGGFLCCEKQCCEAQAS